MIPRRALAGLAAGLASPAMAQLPWPTRTVTLVVPYPPGGSSDNTARPLAQEWSRVIGQSVVIENRGGAGATIGADLVSRARPDGYTLLLFPTAVLTISPHMMPLPYDAERAFTPIAMVSVSEPLVAIHPALPVRSIAELVAYAKAHPGELRFGSAGNGTITQMQGEIFADAAGIRLEHVPYRGSGPALTDLLAGRIQLMFDPVTTASVRDGRLIALATFAEQRSPEFPDVPTLAEAGLADRGALSWFGIAGPAGIAPEIQARIAETLEQALKAPQVAQAMAVSGIRPAFLAGEAFADRIRADRDVFGALVRRTGARAN